MLVVIAPRGEDAAVTPSPGRGALVALLLLLPATARAEDPEAARAKQKRERIEARFERIRGLATGIMSSGTSLVDVGSRGRYRRGGVQLEVDVHRFFTDRFGFGLVLQGLPPAGTSSAARDILFGRAEGFLEAAAASWEGSLPGSLVLGAGVGGDGPRYWFSENGRFYGAAFARLRLAPVRDTRAELTYTALPVALAAQHVRLHEHRLEIAVSWKLLQLGTRVAYTFSRGGEPVRDYFQQELGAFVGLSVY